MSSGYQTLLNSTVAECYCGCDLVDILDLRHKVSSLYECAQLDGDNSELDALKRLAFDHSGNAALLINSKETSPLPSFALSAHLHTSSQPTTMTTAATTAVSTSGKSTAKLEPGSSVTGSGTKLLLIPRTLPSAVKQHWIQDVGYSREQDDLSGRGTVKRRCTSDCRQKSVPFSDVMNVRQSLVSLVPLSTVTSSQTTTHKSDWKPKLTVKLEPGVSCPWAAKRKQPVEPGMYLCRHFSLLR